MASHILVCVQGVPRDIDEALDRGFNEGAYSVWHHLHGVWVLCIQDGSFLEWSRWIMGRVQDTQGRALLLEIDTPTSFSIFMPASLGDWLKLHLSGDTCT